MSTVLVSIDPPAACVSPVPTLQDLIQEFPISVRAGPSIALVNVPYGRAGQSMRPLGLTSLGAYLSAHGISAEGFDFSDSSYPVHELVSRYGLYKYPVVGLSFYNTNAVLAFEMALAIKAFNKRTLVIAGGPHASALYGSLFERHPEIDVVIKNEGEQPLLELLTALRSGTSATSIAGVAFHVRESPANEGEDPRRLDDLDSLPPPIFDFTSSEPPTPIVFFDLDTRTTKPATAFVSSRSCPYNCSFCAIILIGRRWRHASPSKIVEDLKAVESHDGTTYGHIYFLDANFFVRPNRALEVARELHAYRQTLTFSFSTRVNQLIKGAELLPALRSLGLRAVELGIESGSQRALERYAKDTTVEQNIEAIQLLRTNGLALYLDFIFFDAEASVEDLALNIAFLERCELDSYVPWDHLFSHMTPYLGTRIRGEYEFLHGRSFDSDRLPAPESLLLDPIVGNVFAQMERFKSFLPSLRRAVEHLEVTLADQRGVDFARSCLNAATLRRVPFVIMRKLVKGAQAGESPILEDVMPRFTDDSRSIDISLEEFLERQHC